MFRNIPNTITAIRKALREAKEKYDGVIALSGTPFLPRILMLG